MNAGGKDQGEEQKSEPPIDQKRPEGVKIEEDKDRVAREREHPGRYQTAERLRINADAPRRAERDQRQNEDGAPGRHKRDSCDLRRQRVQEPPLQKRGRDSPIERQRRGEYLNRPKREHHKEPYLDHAPQPTFAHAERERVDVSAEAQVCASPHEDEKKEGQRSCLEIAEECVHVHSRRHSDSSTRRKPSSSRCAMCSSSSA